VTFAHDTEAALQCAAALINTGRSGVELLPDPAALDDFARSWKWTGPFAGDADELAAVHAIRARLAPLWEMPEDKAVELVNTLLREERVLPQLVRHPPVDYWHVHAVPNDAPLAARMAVDVALAVADLIRAGELARMRVCTAPDCDDVFIDLSKNRSRRFCGTVCSNRVNVAAYRQRHTPRPLPMATRATRNIRRRGFVWHGSP
jgi:predicted RNA-binding Zn ribbon-like protein